MNTEVPTQRASAAWWQQPLGLLAVFVLLFAFLVGVQCLSGGIKGLGAGVMNRYFAEASNPILGLLVGILATTLVQSSSVTTSLLVGLVASGELPVATAIPMVMGANIGTTVTNTIASLAQPSRGPEFKRAFAAATCHDFFNFLSVLLLLPLELGTRALWGEGILQRAASFIAEATYGAQGTKYHSPVKAVLKTSAKAVKQSIDWVFDDKTTIAILMAVAGVAIIMLALTLIVRVMRGLVMSKLENYLNRFLGSGGLVGVVLGVVLTVLVQSSSITTSVLVPLAGAGLVTVAQVFPIAVGANLGTTVTALLASMVVAGDAGMAARQIALVHLCFNLLGTLIWFVPPLTRRAPLAMAERLATFAATRKRWAIVYVLAVFYALPATIFFLSRAMG